MTTLAKELESLSLIYGTAIPPLPRQPRIATRTVRWDMELDVFCQRVANTRVHGYDGSVETLVRHAVSLFLLAIANTENLDATPIKFQMDILRREQEEEDYMAFIQFAQAKMKDATDADWVRTTMGRDRALGLLSDILATLRRQPSDVSRPRMQKWLVTDRRFIKMVKELGDDRLQGWLELAT